MKTMAITIAHCESLSMEKMYGSNRVTLEASETAGYEVMMSLFRYYQNKGFMSADDAQEIKSICQNIIKQSEE